MAELAQMATDVTKSSNDKALYQTEVDTLKKQLSSMITEEFNGISLFGGTATTNGSIATGTDAATLTVVTSHDGNQDIDIAKANLTFLSSTNGIGAISSPGTSGGIQVGTQAGATAAIDLIDTAIQNLATLRATNGSEQVRLTFAADMLAVNKTNLEAANGRITDVDIASESANLARLNILQQAGTAMLAQANQANQSILRLLM